MIHLSAEAKKLVHARRSAPETIQRLDAKAMARQAAKIAKQYRAGRYTPERSWRELFGKGFEVKNSLDDARRAAHDLLLVEPKAKEPLAHLATADLDVLAIAECMTRRSKWDESLLAVIAFARAPEDAIDVLLRTVRLVVAAKGGWTNAVYVQPDEDAFRHHRPHHLDGLRNAVCALDDTAYERARGHAARLRRAVGPGARAELAYVFPDEPWGGEELAEWTPSPGSTRRGSPEFLLSTSPPLDVIRKARPHAIAIYAVDLVHSLAERDAITLFAETLPGLLKKPAHGPLLKTPPREVMTALTCIRSKPAAELIASHADNAILAPMVLAYFAESPELGDALTAAAKGKPKLSKVAERALGTKSTKGRAAAAPQATDVPSLLVDRPWRSKSDANIHVVEGLTLLEPEKVGLPPSFVDRIPTEPFDAPTRPMTADEILTWRAKVAAKDYTNVDYCHERLPSGGWVYLEPPEEDVLRAWNETEVHANHPAGIVARFGVRSIPGFLRRNWIKWLEYDDGDGFLDLVTRFVSPAVAWQLARAAQRAKARRTALAWFRAHPLVAALGLVPHAVGPLGEVRKATEAALLYLVARGEGDAIRTAGCAYGAPAEAAIDALLARDPLAIGAGALKPPSFLRRDRLPPVLTVSGALPDEARDSLLEMLQVSELDPPYEGISRIRAICTQSSLGELALELFEQWVMADAPGRHDWMLDAIVHFPSDAAERRLAALTREWARTKQVKAIRGCHALAALATDFALLHLSHVAETTRFDGLRKEATSALRGAAQVRGLTEDELGDRTVGEWTELGDAGVLELSLGSRALTVTLSEHLTPVLRDASGAVLRSFPRAAKGDDAEKLAAAKERFETLKTDLAQLGVVQVRRIERAMVSGRRWSEAEFRERLAGHRLLRHLARRLVWIADAQSFRVAEDGTFADANDRAFRLAKSATVRLAHPALDDLSVWARVFADYEIIQPFPQVGREVLRLNEGERSTRELSRTAGIEAKATKLMGTLESRGWKRSSPGHVSHYEWMLRGTVPLRLSITPGFTIADLKYAGAQTTRALSASVPFGEADPVALSEALRDAEALR